MEPGLLQGWGLCQGRDLLQAMGCVAKVGQDHQWARHGMGFTQRTSCPSTCFVLKAGLRARQPQLGSFGMWGLGMGLLSPGSGPGS